MGIEYCSEMIDIIKMGYNISPHAFKIGNAALCGMLYEVSTTPSPGLVSPYSTGAHSDMDFFMFLKSTSSISGYMSIFAQIGMDFDRDILKKVRAVGLEAEETMLNATGRVNTQRGLLFLLGVVCAAAGRCIKSGIALNRYNISDECSKICSGIVDRELRNISKTKKLTNGERLYAEYGVTGIRGEIEKGLPAVINHGLPSYEEALNSGLNTREALSHSLVHIMTSVEDTTVINRCGIEGLRFMKECAEKAVFTGGMKTAEGREYIEYMEKVFIDKNISPGGAADLLAVTAMIYELEKGNAEDEV